jgi:predicted RNase H-like HicB family nuclease
MVFRCRSNGSAGGSSGTLLIELSDLPETHNSEEFMMEKQLKIIVEKHSDVYVAYPLGNKGVIVGQGNNYEEALNDVKSAIQFHLETFGRDAFDADSPILEVFVTEAGVAF